ncbi:hypothetical protein Tco_0624750 [Tanacetum coccineum]|uniref:Reverse transcriptase domain-containing protein n=1 Tax=Tanacetum coccineum TaxID=301880 RepID=A0ABQ4WEV9_9ASTR
MHIMAQKKKKTQLLIFKEVNLEESYCARAQRACGVYLDLYSIVLNIVHKWCVPGLSKPPSLSSSKWFLLFLSMVALRADFSDQIEALDKETPILPFFSVFVMEVLIKLPYDGLDDVIWNTNYCWYARDLENHHSVLHVFYLASGLKINIHKSNIYGIGVNEDEVYNIWAITRDVIAVISLFAGGEITCPSNMSPT